MKGFKYQITVKFLLRKYRKSGDTKFVPVYFKSTTKTVINSEYNLDKSFKEFLYRIDNWTNYGYVNISIYSLLSGSPYIQLPNKLKNPMKGTINSKNSDNNCFLWCHIRNLNPERITNVDKK